MVNKTGVAVRCPLRSSDLTGRVGLVYAVRMEEYRGGVFVLYFLRVIGRAELYR